MLKQPLSGAKAEHLSSKRFTYKKDGQILAFAKLLNGAISAFWLFLFRSAAAGVGRFYRAVWEGTSELRKNAAEAVGKIAGFIAAPLFKPVKAWRKLKKELSKTEKRKLGIVLRHIGIFIFGKDGIAVTAFNYALPIISFVFLFSVISYTTDINYAVKLSVNGQFLGYIENEQVFTDAELVMNQRMSFLGSSTAIEAEPSFSIEKIGYSETLTKYQVADLILQNSGISIEYAYGFYINDVFYGAVTDNSRIKATLESLLAKYDTNREGDTVSFVDDIRYEDAGLYFTQSIIDDDEILNRITGFKTVSHYYSVEYGDSHTLIGDKLDMTQDEIEKLNPGFIESDLHIGDQIRMNFDEPYLSVSITTTEEYDVPVDYGTEYVDDSSLYVGVTAVNREGVDGVEHRTARVSYVNGYEIKRTVISTKTLSNPTSEIVAVGTKPTPAGTYSNASAAYGHFIWPVNGGHISEYSQWDGGYAGHAGIDIAAPWGTAIYAGASGTVVYSGVNGGYGNCVMIKHDNGLTTLYGHCSQLYVSVGQAVTQGECIAAVGETGYAFGAHLHFEVRNGSTKYNPIAYIDF